jgi:hypothetical protein
MIEVGGLPGHKSMMTCLILNIDSVAFCSWCPILSIYQTTATTAPAKLTKEILANYSFPGIVLQWCNFVVTWYGYGYGSFRLLGSNSTLR